jgi:predicted enzyme related to lactoylglutathione lyase
MEEVMATMIAGYILRAKKRNTTVRFYEALGIDMAEQEHGGPKHFEMTSVSAAPVFELYQRTKKFPQDTLMLAVDSIDEAIAVAREFGIVPLQEARLASGLKIAYISDPDGRPILLLQNLNQ